MSFEPSRIESTQNTPASVGGTSGFSDPKSAVTLNDQRRSGIDTTTGEPGSAPVHPEFAFADGNIEIQATDQSFWVHEYHLIKFSVFATLIETAKNSEVASDTSHRTTVVCDKRIKGVDIYNTLKVIYASHIDGIPDFDSNIMTSALRIASAFGYPSLRKFAISKLEDMNLRAIQRIQLSDEFSLPSFETPAFTELCSRKEPITVEEANVLGISRFVEIARAREVERTRWAASVVKGDLLQVLDSSLKPDSSMDGNPDNDFEYSSGRSELPRCSCQQVPQPAFGASAFGHTGFGNTSAANRCSIHDVAPRVLTEGKTLFKHRNELLDRLRNAQSAVSRTLERGDFPSSSDISSAETEPSRVPWTHRVR